jgi:Alpha-N-acetylglucosaminidase (NAGLU) N-terminal domain
MVHGKDLVKSAVKVQSDVCGGGQSVGCGAARKIVLRGNNGVAVASALNWYLKYFCHCQVSWCGDNLDLPAPLPVVKEKVRHVMPCERRVYAAPRCGKTMSHAPPARWRLKGLSR